MIDELKESLLAAASNSVMITEDFKAQFDAIDFLAMAEMSEEHGTEGYSVEGSVARINVRGLLAPSTSMDLTEYGVTGYNVINHYISKANEDQAVASILLDIDSGGGYVEGLSSTLDAIDESAKPVDTYASGDMNSAAYWVGVSGREVRASENSSVGSIGAYVEHMDRSDQLKANGVTPRIFKSGFWKGAFSSTQPLSERAQARLQTVVDEHAQSFFAHVSGKRGISVQAVSGLEGDTFSSERSLELKLIDKIGAFEMLNENNGSQAGGSVPVTATVAAPDAPVFSAEQQAHIDGLMASAAKDAATLAVAAANAATVRSTAIDAVANADDALKALAKGDDFASVATDKLVELLEAMPVQSFGEAMNQDGGAGVEANPQTVSKETDAEAKAEAQTAALATIKSSSRKVI